MVNGTVLGMLCFLDDVTHASKRATEGRNVKRCRVRAFGKAENVGTMAPYIFDLRDSLEACWWHALERSGRFKGDVDSLNEAACLRELREAGVQGRKDPRLRQIWKLTSSPWGHRSTRINSTAC